ncbi:MAG TPA: carboxypeptidase regulatory-like domain-containing protein [Longimicrobiales bacterium]|nr:carboxypeptidase regulatory-like domain-containing protein [Longimicrobiales bacterium]
MTLQRLASVHRRTASSFWPVLFVGALTHVASAQEPPPAETATGGLHGVVVEASTYRPVASATVTLVGADLETRTDWLGTFSLPDVPAGSVSVRVAAPGQPSIVEDIEVGGGRVVFLQIILPSVSAVLDGLLVEVRRSRGPSTDAAQTASDLVGVKVPSLRAARPGNLGKNDHTIYLRSPGSFTQSVAPLVFIDGIMVSRTEDALEALERIPASDVQEIQVLQGPAAAFLYPFAANGVVLVKTRTGTGR